MTKLDRVMTIVKSMSVPHIPCLCADCRYNRANNIANGEV